MPDDPAARLAPATDACIDLGDRRALDRLPCHALPAVRYLLAPSMRPGAALLYDLTAEGVALLAGTPLEPGTALLLQLPGPPHARPTHSARVAHATAFGPNVWLVGCRLTAALSAEDLARLCQLFAGAGG
jgi:hypothetical protein